MISIAASGRPSKRLLQRRSGLRRRYPANRRGDASDHENSEDQEASVYGAYDSIPTGAQIEALFGRRTKAQRQEGEADRKGRFEYRPGHGAVQVIGTR